MADDPTIEEAIKHAKFVADYYDGWVPETSAAIRTLLDAYAKERAEVKEAVRLMKPFVSYDFPEADGWYGAYQLELFAGEREGLIDSFTVEDFRALSTYVTNHEASDGK